MRPLSAAALVLAATGVLSGLRGQPPAVVEGAVVSLLVATAGTVLVLGPWSRSTAADTAALVLVGAAGSVLAGLLSDTPGFVIVYLALAGSGLRLRLDRALVAGALVFAAMNVASFLAGLPLSGVISQDIGGAFVFAVGAFTRSARMAQHQAKLARVRAEELLTQLRAAQAAQAEAAALSERARLAREIHDVLAHALSGLVLVLDAMALQVQQGNLAPQVEEPMLDHLTRAQRLARDGLADIRRAIAALRGDVLPGPAMLDQLVRETAATTGIRAVLIVSGTPRPVTAQVGLTLYRTAQEALTNTTKYAGRQARAELRLTYRPDGVELVLEDVAGDVSLAKVDSAEMTFGGYGLTGLRERAELLGGSLSAAPTATGFEVALWLPSGSSDGGSHACA